MTSALSPTMSLWLGLILSLLSSLLFGLNMAFNVYALPLKETFNLTQTQVEIAASMGTTGMALSCLETICTWLFGYKTTCLIITIGVPASSGLYSLAAYYNEFFSDWPSLIYLIQLTLGITNCLAYVAISRVCVEIFPTKHSGKLVAAYSALCCCGKIYFAGLIEVFFENNLAGFFLSVSVVSACLYGTCFTFLYPLATNKKLQADLGLDQNKENSSENTPPPMTTTTREMLTSAFFHAVFWSSVLFYGCGYTSVNNITTFAHSVGLLDPLRTVFLISFVIVIVRLAFGVIFDKFYSLFCGFWLLMASYLTFLSGVVICVFYLDISNMFVTTILIGTGMGPGMATPISILLWRYGRSHYSAVVGSFFTVSSTFQILLQIMLGFWYDSTIRERGTGGTSCYGRDCFYGPFCVMLGITVIVIGVQTLNFSIYFKFKPAVQEPDALGPEQRNTGEKICNNPEKENLIAKPCEGALGR